jgi:hypothetical protein
VLKAKVYFADIKGQLCQPAMEIAASEWVKDTGQYALSDITSKIIGSLRNDGYL